MPNSVIAFAFHYNVVENQSRLTVAQVAKTNDNAIVRANSVVHICRQIFHSYATLSSRNGRTLAALMRSPIAREMKRAVIGVPS